MIQLLSICNWWTSVNNTSVCWSSCDEGEKYVCDAFTDIELPSRERRVSFLLWHPFEQSKQLMSWVLRYIPTSENKFFSLSIWLNTNQWVASKYLLFIGWNNYQAILSAIGKVGCRHWFFLSPIKRTILSPESKEHSILCVCVFFSFKNKNKRKKNHVMVREKEWKCCYVQELISTIFIFWTVCYV